MRLTGKIVTIALAALATLAGAASAHASPRTVSMINGVGPHDRALSQTQIRGFEPGVLEDANSYLAPAWGVRTVRFANVGGWTSSLERHAGWRMFLTRLGLGKGVIGYHDVDRYGPYAVVSVTAARRNGTPVSRAVSHELNEMMIDPYGDLRDDGYRVEVADPVAEVDARLKGVAVADFTTPNWYVWSSDGPWDAASVLAGDHSTTPGGYAPTTFLKTHERVPAHLRRVTLRRGDGAQTYPAVRDRLAKVKR